MPTNAGSQALAAFKLRQCKGARFDAASAPAAELLLARRGAAYFARQLNSIVDTDLQSPALRQGWTRAQIVADVSCQARGLAIALRALHGPLSQEETMWEPDIANAATLPPRALRYLYAHSDTHLNVELRDLTNENWDNVISFGTSKDIAVRDLPILRAKSIWTSAYLLGAHGLLRELPVAFRDLVV